MDRAFGPDDPVAMFVATLSIALGDLRIVGKYVPRDDQPDHERIYFVRIMASHLREIVKVIDIHADKPKIVDFVASLPAMAREARTRIPDKLAARSSRTTTGRSSTSSRGFAMTRSTTPAMGQAASVSVTR